MDATVLLRPGGVPAQERHQFRRATDELFPGRNIGRQHHILLEMSGGKTRGRPGAGVPGIRMWPGRRPPMLTPPTVASGPARRIF
ncbi:hypothetical protein Sme01_52870 [Sphaerisporangium melleum]|nr:hypothetical protein Sme01_52870 [Sphaerisporangium melleum]